MVALATAHEGCFGARMIGAGFGGYAVALVARGAVEDFARTIAAGYETATGLRPAVCVRRFASGGLRPAVYVCRATAGASLDQGVR